MNKKTISILLLTLLLFSSISISVAETKPTIKEGEFIQLGKYLDNPILWRCVDINENGPLMLAEKALCFKPFDASGQHQYRDGAKQADNRKSDRAYRGSNMWETSSLRSWLNSSEVEGKVPWPDGCIPDDYHVAGVPSENEKGFLTGDNFTAADLTAVKPVMQKIMLNELDAAKLKIGGTEQFYAGIELKVIPPMKSNGSKGYYYNLTDRMFLLGADKWVELSKSNILRAVDKIAIDEAFWLRDPAGSARSGSKGLSIYHSDFNYKDAFKESGVRPAFYLSLPTAIFKSGNGTAQNPYIVTGNGSEAQMTVSAVLEDEISEEDTVAVNSELEIPTNVKLDSKSTTITVTWDKVADADYYYVYYKNFKSKFATATEYVQVKVTGSSKAFSGLAKSTQYSFKITAVNSGGESEPTKDYWKFTGL